MIIIIIIIIKSLVSDVAPTFTAAKCIDILYATTTTLNHLLTTQLFPFTLYFFAFLSLMDVLKMLIDTFDLLALYSCIKYNILFAVHQSSSFP